MFIADAWYKSWRGSKWAGTGRYTNSFSEVHNTIKALTERGMQIDILEGTTIDTIVGFIAYEVRTDGRYVVHYVFVKDALRKRGFSKQLFEGIPTKGLIYTHKTKLSRYLPRGSHRNEIARRKHLE